MISPSFYFSVMYSIFFDLETTDKEPIGQILNYCFITVNQDFEQVSSLVGDIRISNLQLPQAGAILANRTNVIEHQKSNVLSEYQAMLQIWEYIYSMIKESPEGKVFLVGYNSTRFDIPYLRTSFIRNGFNPYFEGRIIYKDLLHIVRKLACFEERFERTAAPNSSSNDLSLTLETTSKKLGLLDGVQQHHSLADVELTIDLAKAIYERYALDFRTEPTYLATDFKKGDIGLEFVPNYNLDDSERCETRPVMLLDSDYRYALWVRLDKFLEKQDKSAIVWVNKSQSASFIKESVETALEYKKLVPEVFDKLKDITLKNFFEKSTCDIEQDIYRLDMRGIDLLNEAITAEVTSDSVKYKNQCRTRLKEYPVKEVNSLYVRYKLANFNTSLKSDENAWRVFKQYVDYRYRGKLQLKKQIYEEEATDNYSLPYETLYAEIEKQLALETNSEEDLKLMQSLKQFYLESEIYLALNEQ